MPMITIDNIDYNTEDLSGDGLIQLANLQFLEGQIQKIRQELAIYQTAQDTHGQALKAGL